MQPFRFLPFIAFVAITACASSHPADPSAATSAKPGSDRDEHGCIPSAGYAWCARIGRCERPWELARAENFANTRQAFAAYCGNAMDAPAKNTAR